ncbi:uncharacterized protein LOC110025008 [Phalaenopsis equestris]|uniref:uncharacterized protein LOC110025008 n=1 Tax=Phalaenopsis equestris TaxID=78828 RepID=UPI0009E2CB22|nr:uncharacterized protein LOC110025008 [Phalaenopsis equestris]
MARGGVDWVRGVKWFSYKRIFIGVCCVNVFLSIFLLRSLYSSYFASSSSSTDQDGVFSEEQIKRFEESIRIRQALEPVELVRLAKKVKKELKSGKKGFKLSKSVNQKLALEILARLKGSGSSVNLTKQREVVELWRVEKIDEIKRLSVANSTKDSIPSKATKKLKIVLELHWQKFLEGIGFWLPSVVTNTFLDDKPDTADELEEEIIPGRSMPPECHTELHTDYAGAAVRWGLTHHTESAADCCQACLDQAKSAKPGGMKCNIWVYCPSEYGCYSPDIYEHKHQECWLKQDEKPRLSFKHKYSESYRSSHPTAPVAVPWMSGVISR